MRGARVAPATVQGDAVPAGFGEGLVGGGDDDEDGGGEEDDDDDDDDDDSGTEDTPSEDTDDEDGIGGEARRDTVGSGPRARIRQSPRLAELEANSAAVTSMPHNNTNTHRSGSE